MHVPEKDLTVVQLDLPARVVATALGNQEFKGYVKRIAPVVDAKTGLVKVTIGFKAIGQLRPGMYVDIELITDKRPDAILISKRALVHDQDLKYVFRLLPERKVERVVVEDEWLADLRFGFGQVYLPSSAGPRGSSGASTRKLSPRWAK